MAQVGRVAHRAAMAAVARPVGPIRIMVPAARPAATAAVARPAAMAAAEAPAATVRPVHMAAVARLAVM